METITYTVYFKKKHSIEVPRDVFERIMDNMDKHEEHLVDLALGAALDDEFDDAEIIFE